jgi:hypothetical protein
MWWVLTKSLSNAQPAIGFLRLNSLIIGIRLLLWKSRKKALLMVTLKKRIMFAEIIGARKHSQFTGLNLYGSLIDGNSSALAHKRMLAHFPIVSPWSFAFKARFQDYFLRYRPQKV